MPSDDVRRLANGRWFQLLTQIGGIDADFLQDEHGPCPLCAGTDRFRWDDRNGDGSGYCNQCGGKNGTGGAISGFDLLMRARGWDFKTAAREVTVALGGEVADAKPEGAAKRKAKPARIPEKPPVDAKPPALGRAVLQWCYTDLQGEQLYWIQRFEDPTKPDRRGKPRKTMVHRTWQDGGWHFPKRTDEFTSEWPSPRPLLGQHELVRRPEAPVLVVEGETTYDAACLLFPNHVVLTWSNGSKGVGHVVWDPLKGRDVTIWPDKDRDGEQCTAKLIGILRGVGAASIAVVKPPQDAPVGWDLADAEDWDEAEAARYLEGNCGEALEGGGDDGPPLLAVADDSPPKPERPFAMLGFAGDDYYYQPGDSGQVTRIGGASHASTSLYRLAPIDYWEKEYPRFNKARDVVGIDWQQCFSDLFREQHIIGCYDPSRIRGVGAWWDDGRVVFHLGDRLIVDGACHPVLKPHRSHFIYQRLPRRDGPGDAVPLSDQEGVNLLSIAERFHWESRTSGTLLAGWTALAPICGALEWRPHVWLNAVAGSGKSSLMDLFVAPLMSDMGFFVLGNTTEAGIRQKLKSDALPVVFDEAESNEKRDTDRMQGVLSLARAASSEGRGVTVKGSVASEAMMFNVRSMFMLSSINMALKQGADRSRFSVLMLRIPDDMTTEAKAEHWRSLKADLVGAITAETGRSLVARMVNLIPEVRESAKVFSAVAAVELDGARVGDQIGTLLAGAWMLQNQRPPTPEEAKRMIRLFDWEQHGKGGDERGGDQGDCLQTILQARLRVETERGVLSRTVGELLHITDRLADPLEPVSPSLAVAELGRHGIKVEGDYLLISNIAKGLKALLRETQWGGGGWSNLLASLPGAKRWGMTRFKGLTSATRAVGVPRSLLAQEF
jgi:putative DNA primase/helicase